MPLQFTLDEIRKKYEVIAPRYDLIEGITEVSGLHFLRRNLIRQAAGNILEVAAGTGRNLRYYPKGGRITAVDASLQMLKIAARKAKRTGLDVQFCLMAGEALGFPDQSFDTVVSSLTLCTFIDPVSALREMKRVCKPEGKILLLEHGRSDRTWLAGWQDRRADRHARWIGCHWNREPFDLVSQAGLKSVTTRRMFFGMIYLVEARP
ncbi:MAG: class I SAM-dependent methyltransferase [Nitrospiria bacterium]